VRQVVGERVALLPEPARAALACGAILGREPTAAAVARMQETLPAKVIDDLGPALRAGLIVEAQPGQFVFSHVLVRDAIEEGLSASERAVLHAQAEAALAGGGEGVDVLVDRCRHALTALELDPTHERASRAMALASRATAMLEERGAHDRAWAIHARVEQARRVGVMDHAPPPSERLRIAGIARAAGRTSDARRICEEVLDASRAAGDAIMFARAALALGDELRPGMVIRELVTTLEEAIAGLGDRDATLACLLSARLAAALQPAPDPAVPVAMARDAIARARAIGDDAVLLQVLEHAGSALVDFAPVDERIAVGEEMLARALVAGDRRKVLRAHARLAVDRALGGDWEGFERGVDRMLEIAEHPRERWRPLLLASLRALTRGDFAESERCFVEVAELSALTDDPELSVSLATHRMTRAQIMHADDELRRFIAEGNLVLRQLPMGELVEDLFRVAMHMRLGEREAAAALYARRSPVPAFIRESMVELTSEIVAYVGTDDERRKMRETLARAPHREIVSGHIPMSYEGPVVRHLGLLDAELGDLPAAERELREAHDLARARGHTPWVARIGAELADVLARSGRADEARDLRARSLAIAEEIGMSGLVRLLRAAHDLEGEAPAAAAPATTQARPAFTLACEGDVWRVTYGKTSVRVRDSRGLRLLARLVERPDEEIHVLVLASDEGAAVREATGGALLDERARRAYKERLADLSEAIDEAERNSDAGRLAKLRRERDMLEAEIARAVGLGGRAREAGSATERARVNVQRRLKDAIARVAEADAAIGRFLERAVRTGTYCCFRP
jgi:hypothetical protein